MQRFAARLLIAATAAIFGTGFPLFASSASFLGTEPMRLLAETVPSAQQPTSRAPRRAIFQYGLSSVLVGRSANGASIGYRHELLVLVPNDLAEQEEQRIRQVVPEIVARQAQKLMVALDKEQSLSSVAFASTAKSKETFDKALSDLVVNVNAEFVAAATEFKLALRSRLPALADRVELGIGTQPCNAPSCVMGAFAYESDNRSFARFAKLHEWMTVKAMPNMNLPYVLNLASVPAGAKGDASSVARATYVAAQASFDKGYEWQSSLSEKELREAFVNAAQRARHTHLPMSYVSAELASLPLEATAHVADVFDSALAAGARLKSNPAIVLAGISDERARARLVECIRLRGTFDTTAAANCAGVKATEVELAHCMAGGKCMPAFGDTINPGALLASPYATAADLAQSGALPRLNLGTIDEVKTQAGKCAEQYKDNGDAAFCLVKSRLHNKALAQLDCIESTARKGAAGVERCATGLLSATNQAQISCLKDKGNTGSRLAICLGLSTLPPATQKLVGCVED